MQFLRVNGVTIHYRLTGDPAQRPAIVFSNSLGTDFRIWDDLTARLSDRFAILAYDKRGHGLSDIGVVPYRMDDHVSDLSRLLDHLGISGAVVCGLSVGGVIAQGLYVRRPDLVRALVLCDTAAKIGTDETWNTRIAAVEAGGIAALADSILERWFTAPFRSADNPVFSACRNMLVRQTVAGYTGTCAALRDCDYTEDARKIMVPTLCIVGDEDGSTPPALVAETARLIPGARLEIIAGAGHIPCVEQPDALAGAITAFLAEAGIR